METRHHIFFNTAANMNGIDAESVDLIVTSPPYPMIEIWDEMFQCHNPAIMDALDKGNGMLAFEWMHQLLDPVWEEAYRVLKPGGIACINVGDATRTLNGNFILYPNHARILSKMVSTGFTPLPLILWRKQTNAPNKFMGSGMMPPGAYVTLEHEYILILRKGSKREFHKEEKQNRMESAYFWEERNSWFSDIWFDIKGTRQTMKKDRIRLRSAAFPFEIPYRLINMYTVKNDVVLDPFLGTGTTMFAAMAAGRNSLGFEIERGFLASVSTMLDSIIPLANNRIESRFSSHMAFIENRLKDNGRFKHKNLPYGFPVITKQEEKLTLNTLSSIEKISETQFLINYAPYPQQEYNQDWRNAMAPSSPKTKLGHPKKRNKPVQQTLL